MVAIPRPLARTDQVPEARGDRLWRRAGQVARSGTVRLICRRVLQSIPVLWGVTFLTYAMLNLLPGDPAASLLSTGATQAEIDALRVKLHLNEPFFVRYWHWLLGILHGDFGSSLLSGQSVTSIIGQRLPVTLEIVIFAFILALIFAVALGLAAASQRNKLVDRLILAVTMGGLSTPDFVIGLVLIWIFAVHLGIAPAIGYTSISTNFWSNVHDMVLPATTLAIGLCCSYTRLLRADLVDQLVGEEYVVFLRSKGLSNGSILMRHVFKNSLFSLITVVALNLGLLIGGTVIIEQIFALPGIGQELLQAITNRDAPIVLGIVILFATAVVLANLLADLAYALLDPRIRYGRSGS